MSDNGATAIRLTDQGRLNVILAGIDRTETESKYGWWETSDGARFGAERLREVEALVAELTAQRDQAREIAAALEAELAQQGRCGDLAPTLAGGTALPVCELPAGHEGWHRAGDGCEWTHGAVRRVGVQEQT